MSEYDAITEDADAPWDADSCYDEEEEDEMASTQRELHRLREVELSLTNEVMRLRSQLEAQRHLCETIQESLLLPGGDASNASNAPNASNARADRDEPPIVSACRSGDIAMVEALLSPNTTSGLRAAALQAACQHRRTEIARLLLEKNVRPDVVRADHDSALLWTCLNGDEETARLLLDRGADPGALSGCPLRLVVRGGFPAVARLLVEHGA